MIRAVIFDIDGTLADCEHRRHFVEGEKKNWDAFWRTMHMDQLKLNVATVARHFARLSDLLLVTGRPETYRAVTEAWLTEHQIPFRALFMRVDGDRRHDITVKKEIYQQRIERRYDVHLVVDDRATVVRMWRELGLETWQVAEGAF